MVIYHGSEYIIKQPMPDLGRKNNDYGPGFYCTLSEDMAKEWATLRGNDGYANTYEMDMSGLNAKTIDKWIEDGWEWGKSISHEEYIKATQGEWEVLLTPTVNVPKEWFGNNGDIRGKRILGLASGGGFITRRQTNNDKI